MQTYLDSAAEDSEFVDLAKQPSESENNYKYLIILI